MINTSLNDQTQASSTTNIKIATTWSVQGITPTTKSFTRSQDVSYPHAFEPRQRPQGPQGSQRPQGLDGRELRVAQGVSYKANQGHLRKGRPFIRPDEWVGLQWECQ